MGRQTMITTSNGEKHRITCELLEKIGFDKKTYNKNIHLYVYDDGVFEKIVLKKHVDSDSWSGLFEGMMDGLYLRKLTVKGGLEFDDDLVRCADTVGIKITINYEN